MFARIMVYFLFICSFNQIVPASSQNKNLNYTIQGLYNKLNRLNTINNQDKNGNNNHKNNTQFYIERSPWWLSLKQNNSVIGIPTIKEIELFRKDTRRGRSYYAAESHSHAIRIYPQILQLTCLPLLNYWLNKVKLFI